MEQNQNMDFGGCLKDILANREMTIAQAAAMLGMKSPTSLARVLHGEVSRKALEKLYKQLRDSEAFQLSAEEEEALHHALQVARFGADRVKAFAAVWDFCFPPKVDPWEIKIHIHGQDFYPPKPSFTSLMQYYKECKELELTIIGCCSRYFIEQVYQVISGGIHKPVRIDHYLHQSTETTLPLALEMRAIRPMIACPQYNVYIGEPEKLDEYALNMLDHNSFWMKATEQDGRVRMHIGTLINSGEMFVMESHDEQSFSFIPAAIRHIQPRLTPAKLLFPPRITPRDYLAYTESFLRMESDRAIYSLIPDVCFNFIPADICLSAVSEGISGIADSGDDMEALFRKLVDVHARRWNNIFHSKKVRYYILSANATRLFARTGVLSDHFFAMRPFTPDERRAILKNIRVNMAENPYFNLFFALDESLNFDYELTVYEKLCVMVLDSSTSYRLGQDHAEILITQPQYQDLLIGFFRHELLAHQVHPARESLAIMDQIIASVPAE